MREQVSQSSRVVVMPVSDQYRLQPLTPALCHALHHIVNIATYTCPGVNQQARAACTDKVSVGPLQCVRAGIEAENAPDTGCEARDSRKWHKTK